MKITVSTQHLEGFPSNGALKGHMLSKPFVERIAQADNGRETVRFVDECLLDLVSISTLNGARLKRKENGS